MKTKNNRSSRGFTLLEVLIAVLIVGIIATVALPMLSSYTEKAREAREEANMLVKQKAIDRYVADHKVGLGMVYDPSDQTVTTYGLETMQGPSAQLLRPTDVNGNVLGDPVTADPAPFDRGPYLAELPPEPAAVLLAQLREFVKPPAFGTDVLVLVAEMQGEEDYSVRFGNHTGGDKHQATLDNGILGRGWKPAPAQLDVVQFTRDVPLELVLGKVVEKLRERGVRGRAAKVLDGVADNCGSLIRARDRAGRIAGEIRGLRGAMAIDKLPADRFGTAYTTGTDLHGRRARLVEVGVPVAASGKDVRSIDAAIVRSMEYRYLLGERLRGRTGDVAGAERRFRQAWGADGRSTDVLLAEFDELLEQIDPELAQHAKGYPGTLSEGDLGWDLELPPREAILKLLEGFHMPPQVQQQLQTILTGLDAGLGGRRATDWPKVKGDLAAAIAMGYGTDDWAGAIRRTEPELAAAEDEINIHGDRLHAAPALLILVFPPGMLNAPGGKIQLDEIWEARERRWGRPCHGICIKPLTGAVGGMLGALY